MALVALNLSRDQALQQEVAQQQGSAAAQQVHTQCCTGVCQSSIHPFTLCRVVLCC
jgi:hypothetical protein